jgi:Protein of unknown function (DUF3300)
MNFVKRSARMQAEAVLTSALLLLAAIPSTAQDYPPPPRYGPAQLDNLVSRIALYPDPLLAQVLAAATFPDQIQDAARWADAHQYLRGPDLPNAMAQENVPWDPSVQALIPFASVIDMMASDMGWTSELGNAVLAQRPDVMDSVQRMRQQAESYGYLRSNQQIRVVSSGPAIEIVPYNPAMIYVPVYDPYIVYAPPRPGFYVGTAIGFSAGFPIGAVFGNWGWGGGFNWYNHGLIVHNVPWQRTWVNRGVYVHDYGNWNGGRWRDAQVNRNVIVNNNVVNNNRESVNRNYERNQTFYNTNGNNVRSYQGNNNRAYTPPPQSQSVNRGNQSYAVTPNRGYERHAEPDHSGAFHGTENGHVERNAAQWGRESRGAPSGGHENRGGSNERGGRR